MIQRSPPRARRANPRSVVGENQLHTIFGGGPSYIVHPSDTAPALVALDARFEIVGPEGERTVLTLGASA